MNPLLQKIIDGINAQVSPDHRQAFEQTVIAGLKILFDPSTHAHMQLVNNPASRTDPVNTIAQGVAGLMWLMVQQSRHTLSPEVLVLSAVVLMCHVFDFAERSFGMAVNNTLIAQTTRMLAEKLFIKMGVSPEQLQQAINTGSQQLPASGAR